ncbi:MAG TPA: hypothetical protein VNV43_03355, partial [Candidatus Acidoferrales bacterium]|nr:hypothetical protein [Candidatus Acidoferrales bacterium]
ILMAMKTTHQINVVLFPQHNGDSPMWVAQCVNMDFAAQGKTLPEAQKNFIGTINTHVALCIKHGQTPFQHVPPAPGWFQRDFEMIEAAPDSKPVVERVSQSRMIFKHALAAA